MTFRLLLADDSITIQKVVELILAEEDYEIKFANNGEEAFALLASFSPDIVLADTEMPAMNGYDLCERIKQEPSTSTIPVILLTGAFEPLDEERAQRVKADDYLIKPFEAQELITKINSALAVKALPVQSEIIPEEEILPPGELPEEEEIWTPETVRASAVSEEEGAEASTEELIGIAEEAEREPAAGAEIVQESAIGVSHPIEGTTNLLRVDLLSKDEIKELFETTLQEKISSLLSSVDLKETVIASMTPIMKESVDEVLRNLTPELIEQMLKEILHSSIESLTAEVRKIIRETMPELAETMISQEIERIRSEF